jgi:hypothetical protein
MYVYWSVLNEIAPVAILFTQADVPFDMKVIETLPVPCDQVIERQDAACLVFSVSIITGCLLLDRSDYYAKALSTIDHTDNAVAHADLLDRRLECKLEVD